ncbi:MAG TPA: hypothetical protein VK528_08955 [Flavobacterium sp.]|nr:hypothetical protein [Flavobacterium sp.]
MTLKLQTVMLLFVVLFSTAAFSQTPTETAPKPQDKKQIDFGIDGMIGVSYGSKTLGINVGGPSLKLKINSFKIGVGAFPSLIVVDEKAFPKLAVSPIVEYKKFMLITPYYGYDAKDKMIWTFGIGYKFR